MKSGWEILIPAAKTVDVCKSDHIADHADYILKDIEKKGVANLL